MMNDKKKSANGQALVEFALMITVVLMLIFLIIESSRILWAWTTVQNAAREGARYAITGQFMGPDCAVQDLPKFQHICDEINQANLRTAGIISVTHRALSGLPLDESTFIMEDDNFYLIQVWGADGTMLRENFGGLPGQPVVVRAMYRVPIISPFFSSIIPSIPVVGQVTEYNENFGQLGNPTVGGVPPEVPAIPTAGPTPTPSPTHTPDPDADPDQTPTATATATWTLTPTPVVCGTRFENTLLAGGNQVFVSGDIGQLVTVVNLTTNETIGTLTLGAFDGHSCPGFVSFSDFFTDTPLVAGDVYQVSSPNGTGDLTMVLEGTPTPTPTSTFTPAPTSTPTTIPTATSTPTPSGPFIALLPTCGPGPQVQFNVFGANWPSNRSISIYWNTNVVLTIPQNQHEGSFSRQIVRSSVSNGTYQIVATASGPQNITASAIFRVPCPGATPVPTTTATPTGTPNPADLIVVGPPALISTPPIVAYQPVDYRVVISNTGDVDVNQQFFVDLYLDPDEVFTTTIPLIYSSGYQGIGGLAGRASRVLTITAPFGFTNNPNNPPDYFIYAMVDSLEQIPEEREDNNISTPAVLSEVTPAATPTPTPTREPGDDEGVISGVVLSRVGGNWVPQFRAIVTLVNNTTSEIVGVAQTNRNGFYEFLDLPDDDSYTATACIVIDNEEYTRTRTGLEPPNTFVDLFLQKGPCSQ